MSTLSAAEPTVHPWSFTFTNQAVSDSARSCGATSCILCVWMLGTIFLGKSFVYLHVGPLFITEVVLALLIFDNRSRLRPSDYLLLVATVFYVIMGTIKHGSFVFAGKDIIWLPYLMFLRFFPSNFPNVLRKLIIGACFVKVATLIFVPAVIILDVHKYRDGIILLFCYLYLYSQKGQKPGLLTAIFFIGLAAIIEFKTLMLVMLALPLVLRFKAPWQRFYRASYAILFAGLILIMIKIDLSRIVLTASVDVLNALASFLQIDVQLDTGTSVWRAEIWNRSISRLIHEGELLFGQFPGFNFLDNKYLGINLNLEGGQGLGVVRTAHNIIVQATMNGGVFGLVLYLWYFFRNAVDRHRLGVFFAASVFMLGMTADVLEVPSRGPLFFCLIAILAKSRNLDSANQTQLVQPCKLPLFLPREKASIGV